MKDETCGSCMHHDTEDCNDGWGECRCGPPTRDDRGYGKYPVMPSVTKACGQWQKEKP